MPKLAPGSHILITGANGFVGTWCCQEALSKGFKVTGTVRSPAKGDALCKLFPGKPINYEIVADLSDPHGFDKVIKKYSFDGVLHIASPVTFNAVEPDDIIIPALNGVRAIVSAAHKYGPTIKRIVYTSSDAAVKQPSYKPPQRFDEHSWNTESPEECKKLGAKAGQVSKYRASKAIAEKAFWDFGKNHKDLHFDQVVINPTDVGGPILGEAETYESLGVIQKMFYDVFWNGAKKEADLPGMEDNLVDVRDIAKMHVLSLLLEKAGGERMIGAAMPFCWQDITNIMHKYAPELDLPYGKPGGAEWADDPAHCIIMDGSKATRVLEFEYRSMETTVIDMYEDLKSRKEKYGWASSTALTDLYEKSAKPARGCMAGMWGLMREFFQPQGVRLEGEEKTLSEKVCIEV